LVHCEIINRERYNNYFVNDNNNLSESPFKKENIFVKNLKCSLFPLYISPPDPCHTIGLGWYKWEIKMLREHFPNHFEVMIQISNSIYIPRYASSYIQNLKYIKNWKSKDYLFFGKYILPVLVFFIL